MKKIPKASEWNRIKQLHKIVHNPIPWINETSTKLGSVWYFPFGGSRGIVFTKADHAKYILQKNNKNYIKSLVTTERLGKYIGFGLLTNNGASWLRQRRLIQPGFHKEKLSALTELMVHEINSFCTELDKTIAAKSEVELHDIMTTLTYRIIARSIYSDDQTENDLKRSRHIIDSIQRYMVRNLRVPVISRINQIIGREKYHMNLMAEGRDIIRKGISQRKELQEERPDLLDMLLSSRYEDTGEPMEVEQLIDEILILFAAGHETSANAMTWCWNLMIKHPDILEKVRAEYKQISAQGPLSFQSVMQLSYTKQVIQESMRLYPPAWIMDRVAVEDDEIDGFQIKKGDIIMPFIYGIHRDPDYWEDPDTFDPNRFTPEKFKKLPAYSYFPFGGGPRMCVGFQFAYMEMVLILAMLSDRYEFIRTDNSKIRTGAQITLGARDEIKVRVEMR